MEIDGPWAGFTTHHRGVGDLCRHRQARTSTHTITVWGGATATTIIAGAGSSRSGTQIPTAKFGRAVLMDYPAPSCKLFTQRT